MRSVVRQWLMRLAATVGLIALPFAVLVRGGTYLYATRGWPTYLAIAMAAGVAVLVLTAYGAILVRRIGGKARVRFVLWWIALPTVAVYCVFGLAHLSATNAKTPEVRAEYRAIHPLLRLGLSTWLLIDRDLVATDFDRAPGDYAGMGLPASRDSRHYVQDDGYAHAMDLRTNGRSGSRNTLTKWYFELMGFDTLRHVGTADHLHVSLKR